MDINVLISNPDFFEMLIGFPEVRGIYVEQERVSIDRLSKMILTAHKKGKRLFLSLPYIWNEASEKALLHEIPAIIGLSPDGYLVRNLDELGLLESRSAPGNIILDAGIYTWNKTAMSELAALGASYFTAPYELNKYELTDRGFDNTELVVYGNYPVMISNNCLRLTTGKCQKTADPYGIYRLKDRTGTFFPAVNSCRYCYNVIYNSVPTWLLDDDFYFNYPSIRFNFTTEAMLEAKSVLTNFFNGKVLPKGNFTRGHFKRGAE